MDGLICFLNGSKVSLDGLKKRLMITFLFDSEFKDISFLFDYLGSDILLYSLVEALESCFKVDYLVFILVWTVWSLNFTILKLIIQQYILSGLDDQVNFIILANSIG